MPSLYYCMCCGNLLARSSGFINLRGTGFTVLALSDFDVTEKHSYAGAYRAYTTIHACDKQLLKSSDKNGEDSEVWSQTPYHIVGCTGEFAAPAQANTPSSHHCQNSVTDLLASLIAFVSTLEGTVWRMGPIRLPEYIAEVSLKYGVNVQFIFCKVLIVSYV